MNPIVTKYHSATVEMQLEQAGLIFDVGHLGPDYLILRQSAALHSGEASLRIVVDGVEERFAIRLTGDISGAGERFVFESLGE